MKMEEATNYPCIVSTITNTKNEIPYEIVEMILNNLDGRDLLSCRQVNTQWMSICTDLCRRKYVKLSKRFITTEQLCSTFPDTETLPWSSCHIDVTHTSRMKTITHFLQVFGTKLAKVSIAGSNAELIKILRHTPNIHLLEVHEKTPAPTTQEPVILTLKKLTLTLTPNPIPPEPFSPQSVDLRLTKLTHFEGLVYSNSSLMFLELIVLHSGGKLKSAKIEISLFDAEHTQRASKILSGISQLWLQFNYNKETRNFVPYLTNLFITSLNVNIIGKSTKSSYSRLIKNYYEPLELFLENCSNGPERLLLCYDSRESEFDGRIQTLKFPVLGKLKFFKIFLRSEPEYLYDPNNSSPGMLFLSPLTANQLPLLEELIIVNHTPESLIPAFRSSQFGCVKKLTLDGYHTGDQWGPIFPNLKEICATPIVKVPSRYGIKMIKARKQRRMLFNLLKSMTNLERCEVKFPNRIGCNINTVIFEALSQLLYMKGLNSLKFTLPSYPRPVLNVGALLTLLLPPLHLFFNGNVQISKACEGKLTAFHRSVTIE